MSSEAKENGQSGIHGMTLREHYAGLFMASILANPETLAARPPLLHAERANSAVQAADALLTELARTTTPSDQSHLVEADDF